MQLGNSLVAALFLGTAEVTKAYLGSNLVWDPGEVPAAIAHPSELFGADDQGGFYDLSEPTSLWQDVDGTVAVTASGQQLARVDDLSGKNNHLLQATSGSRPTYESTGGLPCMLIGGSQAIGTNLITNVMKRNNTLLLASMQNSGGTNTNYGFLWAASVSGVTNYVGIQMRPSINVAAGLARAASLGVANAFGSLIAATPNELHIISMEMGDTSFRVLVDLLSSGGDMTHAWGAGQATNGNITTGTPFGPARRIYSGFYINRALDAFEMAGLRDYVNNRLGRGNAGRAVPSLSVPFHLFVARDINDTAKTWKSRVSPGLLTTTLTTEGTGTPVTDRSWASGIPVMLGSRGAWAGKMPVQAVTAGYTMAAIVGGSGSAIYHGPNIFSNTNRAIAQLSKISESSFRATMGSGGATRQKQFLATMEPGGIIQTDRPAGADQPLSAFDGFYEGVAVSADVLGADTTISNGTHIVLGGRYLTTTDVLVNSSIELLAAIRTVGDVPLNEADRATLTAFFQGLRNGTIL